MKVIIDNSIIETDLIYKISELKTLDIYNGCTGFMNYIAFSIHVIGTQKPIDVMKATNDRCMNIEHAKSNYYNEYSQIEKARNELISLWSSNQREFKIIEI